MNYTFPLVLFYRTCYRNEGLYFRLTRRTDLPAVALWVADLTGSPGRNAAALRRMLQHEWDTTASIIQRDSWIAMSGEHRLFLLEFSVNENFFVTGPSILFQYPDLASATYSLIQKHFPNSRSAQDYISAPA